MRRLAGRADSIRPRNEADARLDEEMRRLVEKDPLVEESAPFDPFAIAADGEDPDVASVETGAIIESPPTGRVLRPRSSPPKTPAKRAAGDSLSGPSELSLAWDVLANWLERMVWALVAVVSLPRTDPRKDVRVAIVVSIRRAGQFFW